MITTLVGISYRILLASKSKIIISVIIVALAIGLVSTVTLLIDKMSSSFQREVKLMYGDTDVMIGFRNEEMFNKNQTKLIENKPEVIDTSYVLVNPILGQDFYYVGVDNSFLSK